MDKRLEEINRKFDIVQREALKKANTLPQEFFGIVRVCAESGIGFNIFYDRDMQSYLRILNNFLRLIEEESPLTREDLKYVYEEMRERYSEK